MSPRKALGGSMVATPFIAVFWGVIATDGLLSALGLAAFVAVMSALVLGGMELLS